MQQHYKILASSMMKKLKQRRFDAYYVSNKKEAVDLVMDMIGEKKVISHGGSITIEQCGLLDAIKLSDHHYLNRKKIPIDEMHEFYKKSLTADVYLTSTNAITIDGELINVDGTGNRVAAMIYGPNKVFVLAGMNKIVYNAEDGINRIKIHSAPPNCLRLGLDNPCTKTGYCMDCKSDTRSCNQVVITKYSRIKHRIVVVLIGEHLGF